MAREDKRKFRSQRRAKRKGFHGKRPQDIKASCAERDDQGQPSEATTSENAYKPEEESHQFTASTNMSSQKLLNSSFHEYEDENGPLTRQQARDIGLGSTLTEEHASGFKLIQDAELLSDCISTAAVCSTCRNAKAKLQLYQRNEERDGLAESLFLKCSLCGCETPLSTSRRLGGRGGGAYEINRRAVLASHQWERAGLEKFCGGVNLPPPVTKKAYNDHMKQIHKSLVETAEQLMCDAADRLRDIVAKEEPNKIDTMDDGKVIAKVAVSIDGTWQKRGHSSKVGVVFAISVRTGEILDYSIKSKVCLECKSHNNDDRTSVKYQKWKESHSPKCENNHDGSSEEMEAVGATEIFLRSIDNRGLKYTQFVGDGDSSCFGKVKEALSQKYGNNYVIEKEECIGHVQKRMGTALRQYRNKNKGNKLSDGKGVQGRGRLTETVVDSMQNYYGFAIRRHIGDLEGMKKAIQAIQHHMIKADGVQLEQQHVLCPQDEDTWCKFWKQKLFPEKKEKYKEDNRLPEVFMSELDPIFVRLSKDELLARCLKGLTQNQNETVNGQLWLRCPKSKFCGKRRVTVACCETISVFNTGAASKAVMMNKCGVKQMGRSMMKALRKEDAIRIQAASQKISAKYKARRQKLRHQKTKAKKNKTTAYHPGAFGLESEPEIPLIGNRNNEKSNRKRPSMSAKDDSSAAAAEISFVADPDIEFVHIAKKGKH